MLQTIKKFFDQRIASGLKDEHASEHALQLATSALLYEMMRMDEEQHTAEHAVIRGLITQRFALSSNETEQLLLLAEQEASASTDYHQFTRLINRSFSLEQKIEVVEQLWQVAYADGHLDKYEEHLVRKIAELLYVPHKEFIAAKHRAITNSS